jgi:hypothetical protein
MPVASTNIGTWSALNQRCTYPAKGGAIVLSTPFDMEGHEGPILVEDLNITAVGHGAVFGAGGKRI